jgi:hypothetical protein
MNSILLRVLESFGNVLGVMVSKFLYSSPLGTFAMLVDDRSLATGSSIMNEGQVSIGRTWQLKFYNPKLYKAPPGPALSEGDAIYVAEGGSLDAAAPGGIAGTGIGASLVQISSDSQDEVAPPPPPETPGAYSKKGSESAGVIAMIDLLVKDLDKEMAEAEVMENDAQKEYEEMIADSAAKRAEDTKAMADKNSAKAAAEEEPQALSETVARQGGADGYARVHPRSSWRLRLVGEVLRCPQGRPHRGDRVFGPCDCCPQRCGLLVGSDAGLAPPGRGWQLLGASCLSAVRFLTLLLSQCAFEQTENQ